MQAVPQLTKDGGIDLTVTGGTGTLKYNWSIGDTTQDIVNIEAGNYSVTIADSNQCSALFDFAVPGTNVATANAGMDDTICPGSEYQLIGSVGDTMRWEPASLIDNPDIYNPTVSILSTTEFIYTVYQDGCVDRDTIVLSAYERIGMDIYDPSGQVNIDTALFLLEGETYTMAATPGFESYLWQPGDGLSDPTAEAVVVTPARKLFTILYLEQPRMDVSNPTAFMW